MLTSPSFLTPRAQPRKPRVRSIVRGSSFATHCYGDEVSPLEELTQLLRPAGAGLHTVSTGKTQQQALQRALYGVDDTGQVSAAWRRSLQALAAARVVVL